MRRLILGILFVVLASDPIQAAWHSQREYRDEYTSGKVFIRVLAGLTQVPDDIPDEAITVNLRYNMITEIPVNAFSNLGDCKTLRLQHNEISVIEPGSFNGLNSLTGLDLSYNLITDIPINAFSNLQDCLHLNIILNKISVIESGMFNGLNSVTQLGLWSNKIITLGDDSFSGLTSLQILFLHDNRLTTISDKTFSSLQACHTLHLNINNIFAISERAFTNLSSLTHLFLNENNIQTIQANVFPTNLKYLYLHTNKISALEDVAFTNLVFLAHLQLSGNKISTLSANAFSTLSNCVAVDLQYNPIENIEVGAFHGLDKLTILRLHITSLTHLSQNMFQGLNSLKHLSLYLAKISEIARGAFTGLGQLQSLNLYENELTVIDSDTFSRLVSLEILFLTYNHINDIKDFAFLPLGNLTHLYLYKNQLEHLRLNTFAGLVSLKILDLGDNKLTTLDSLVLSRLPRPLGLAMDVQQSPMVCDNKLCWLKVEEEAGSIAWDSNLKINGYIRGVDYPNCTGGVDWQSLECPVPCRDPGDMEFAERSGSYLPFNNNSQPGIGLPHSTDTEFRYTCDACYTGGGTITCQSNGQWTRKSECVNSDKRVVCRAPVLVDGYLRPSYDQYGCGVTVTYTCDEGFTLSGPPDGTCGPDGQFAGDISSCVKNGETVTATGGNGTETETSSPTTDSPDQGTKPESGATEGGSSGLIYGIVGGVVGGIVLMALIGLTIFCIKRSKKNNPSDVDTTRAQNTVTDGGYMGIIKDRNGLYKMADKGASEAGYMGIIKDKNGLYEMADRGASEAGYIEPTADRGTPEQTVRSTGHEPGYRNRAYDDEYQEIEDALPNNNLYVEVVDDVYEN